MVRSTSCPVNRDSRFAQEYKILFRYSVLSTIDNILYYLACRKVRSLEIALMTCFRYCLIVSTGTVPVPYRYVRYRYINVMTAPRLSITSHRKIMAPHQQSNIILYCRPSNSSSVFYNEKVSFGNSIAVVFDWLCRLVVCSTADALASQSLPRRSLLLLVRKKATASVAAAPPFWKQRK